MLFGRHRGECRTAWTKFLRGFRGFGRILANFGGFSGLGFGWVLVSGGVRYVVQWVWVGFRTLLLVDVGLKAAPQGTGMAGEGARYHGLLCFAAHMCRCAVFSTNAKYPPSPLAISTFFCATPRAARTTTKSPQVPQNG